MSTITHLPSYSALFVVLISLIFSCGRAAKPQPCTRLEMLQNLTLRDVGVYPGGRLMSHAEFGISNYGSNMKCRWKLLLPNNWTLIHVKILSLDLEVQSRRFHATCRYDNLKVYYKNAITSSWVAKVACSRIHLSYFTSTSDVTIWFNTDGSVTKQGFHLIWYFVPRQDAYKIPGLESWTALNCPPVSQNYGTLYISVDGLSTDCTWRWQLGSNHFMRIFIEHVVFDYRDNWRWPYRCCASGINKLTLRFSNELGHRMTKCLCGNRAANNQTIEAYNTLVIQFDLVEPVQGRSRGIRLDYQRQTRTLHTVCPALNRVNRYLSTITGLFITRTGKNCSWIVEPISSDHAMVVSVKCREGMYVYCGSKFYLAGQVISSANMKRRISDSLSNSSSEINYRIHLYQVCCRSTYEYSFTGPVHVFLNATSDSTRQTIGFEIKFQNIPMVTPGSSRSCPPYNIRSIRNFSETRNESFLGSRRDIKIASEKDCISNVVFNRRLLDKALTVSHSSVKLAVNCSSHTGYLIVALENFSTKTVKCNSNADLPFSTYYAMESVETGGFTALFKELRFIYSLGEYCPKLDAALTSPTSVSLPIIKVASTRRALISRPRDFYCVYRIAASSVSNIALRVTIPMGNGRELCSEISTHAHNAQLSVAIFKLDGSILLLNLCEQNIPGDLLTTQREILIKSGESAEIKLFAAHFTTLFNMFTNYSYSNYLYRYGADVIVELTPVEVCQHLSDSAEQWRLSEDGTQLLSSVTVAPDNTQMDCKLQLDALTAAQIVNHTKLNGAGLSNPSTDDCWSLVVQLDKFSAVCGLKQLVLTVSHWDSLAGSIDHSQREICGSDSSFSWSTVASLQAAGSGMSLWYSGLRSGCTARFSISACKRISDRTDKLVDSSAIKGSVSPVLIGVLIALALCNVLVVLFLFRTRIIECARAAASRAPPTHRQLIYRTGADGVNLIDEEA